MQFSVNPLHLNHLILVQEKTKQKQTMQVPAQQWNYTTSNISFFNGPKYIQQLGVHSKKKENEKDMTKWSHLEFHSIFNQEGMTNFQNLQF